MLLTEVLAKVNITVPAIDLNSTASLEGDMAEYRKASGMVSRKLSDLASQHSRATAGESLAHALALLKNHYPDVDPNVILEEDLPESYEEMLIDEMRGTASAFVADADFSLPPP